MSPFHNLPNHNDVIKDVPRFDESSFLKMKNQGQQMKNFESQGFGSDLLGDIQQGDGSLIVDILWVYSFRYEFDVSFIDETT